MYVRVVFFVCCLPTSLGDKVLRSCISPGTHYVDKSGLELTEINLPLPPKW